MGSPWVQQGFCAFQLPAVQIKKNCPSRLSVFTELGHQDFGPDLKRFKMGLGLPADLWIIAK